MKPLESTQQVMKWLCMCAPDPTEKTSKQIAYVVCVSTGIVFYLGMIASSVAFFMKYVSIDVGESLYALYQISVSGMLYVVIVAIFMRHRINSLFQKLMLIYKKCNAHKNVIQMNRNITLNYRIKDDIIVHLSAGENDESFVYLAKVNDRSERIWKMYFTFGLIGANLNIVSCSLGSLILSYYMHGTIIRENLYIPCRFMWV